MREGSASEEHPNTTLVRKKVTVAVLEKKENTDFEDESAGKGVGFLVTILGPAESDRRKP